MRPEEQLSSDLAGRYEVEREIGAGGMATVYLARDVKHNRKVALKVLKPELGAVLGVERFLAEIQVTANLQHPNLLPLFDSGEADGLLFYVMPFVDGETLRARLDREKQLPIDEAIRITTAIASALDYAHQHGVIHRDLKPENILLQSGQPVIADFGIALAVSKAGGARITQTGLSLGTPMYMSPEQATGDRVIDGRTDVYSLGAMTYEMLVGDPPHLGGTTQAIIAKVLTERPPSVRVSRPSVSEEIAWAVEHALEKLPADRWGTAGEFANALHGKLTAGVARARAGSADRSASPRSTVRMRAALAATTAVAVLGVSAAVYLATRPQAPGVMGRFEIGLPDSVTLFVGAGTKLALSRDGMQLALVGKSSDGKRSLYVRRLDDPVARLVRGSESAESPTFSPDGSWLLFKSGLALKKVSASGGLPQALADSTGNMASWGDGGRVLFVRNGALWVGTADGRDAKLIARPDTSRRVYRLLWPELLPGASHALIAIDKSPVGGVLDSLFLGVVALGDGTITELGVAGTNPHYVESGRIAFGRAGGLVFSAPFSLRSHRLTGSSELLAEGVWQGTGGATGFAVSQTGVLALQSARVAVSQLRIVDRGGMERPVAGDPAPIAFPRISPDGRRVAFAVGDVLSADTVWVQDLATGARSRLSPDGTSTRPDWSRDGSRVVFTNLNGDAVYSRPWDQNGTQQSLSKATSTTKAFYEISVGPTGGYWAFRGAENIFIAPTDSLNAVRAFVATPAREIEPRVSPNGHLLAYASDLSGRLEVYVQALPGPGPRVAVSVGGGEEPVWSPDGATLFYRGPNRLMSAVVAERPQLGIGKRDSLFLDRYERGLRHTNYDVLPNGHEFLMVTRPPSVGSSVSIIMNWPQLLGSARQRSAQP